MVYLGNPHDTVNRVEIPGLTPTLLSAAENAGTTPEALAVNLLTTIFKEEELRQGKPRKPGITQLDQVKVKGIRGTIS